MLGMERVCAPARSCSRGGRAFRMSYNASWVALSWRRTSTRAVFAPQTIPKKVPRSSGFLFATAPVFFKVHSSASEPTLRHPSKPGNPPKRRAGLRPRPSPRLSGWLTVFNVRRSDVSSVESSQSGVEVRCLYYVVLSVLMPTFVSLSRALTPLFSSTWRGLRIFVVP